MVINYNKFEVLLHDTKIADVELSPNNQQGTVKVRQYIEGFNRQFHSRDEDVTTEEFLKWLEWRTLPPERFGIDEHLKSLGLTTYNRLGIIRKTRAVMGHDDVWVRFDGEELTYKDVSIP